MQVQKLPYPKKGELYAQFVVQEYNCNNCPSDLKYADDQKSITKHIAWIYQSVDALKFGDTLLLYSEFMLLSSEYYDPHYTGGFLQALKDAMGRGAKVFILTERFWIGGRDSEGNCGTCPTKDKPFTCTDPSKEGRMYNYFCNAYNATLKDLYDNSSNNLIIYDIPYKDKSEDMKIHSHFKCASFYYKSSNRCSIYRGSWNFNLGKFGNSVEEAGFGFTCMLNEPWSQYNLYIDTQHLLIFEKYYNLGDNLGDSITTILNKYKINKPLPIQPIVVPLVVICGPNYCDPNFGCNAVGGIKCSKSEEYVTAYDKNVSFTFGVDPKPQGNNKQDSWKKNGWPKDMVFGQDLLVRLIKGSKKYLKTIMAAQMLDISEGDQSAIYGMPPPINNALMQHLDNKPWFCLQNNDDWVKQSYTSLIGRIWKDSDSTKRNNMYAKKLGLCGKIRSRSSSELGQLMTHAKIWVSDNALLMTTAHPIEIHYNVDLTNYDMLIENSPNITNFVNNHFNYVYNKCGIFTENYLPTGKYKNGLSDMSCPNSNQRCCSSDSYLMFPSPSPFGACVNRIPTSIPPYIPKHIKNPTDVKKNIIIKNNVGIKYVGVLILGAILCGLVYKDRAKITHKSSLILIVSIVLLTCTSLYYIYNNSTTISPDIFPDISLSSADVLSFQTYIESVYPTANWFKSASSTKLSKYFNDLGFFYRENGADNIDSLSKLLKTIVCPVQDCCPHWGTTQVTKSGYCDGKKCLITDEELDKRKYGILPLVGELTWYTSMTDQYEKVVMRNPYDPSDWTKAISYSPSTVVGDKAGWNSGQISLSSGGYPSGQCMEVFRIHSMSGSPDTYYYAVPGTGNFLRLGATLQSRDKVDAMLHLITLAGKNGFAGFIESPIMIPSGQSLSHKTTTNPNTFINNPELLLLELLETAGKYMSSVEGKNNIPDETFQFSMSIPTKGVRDFMNKIGMKNNTVGQYNNCSIFKGDGVSTTFKKWYKGDVGHPNVKPLMIWYYKQKGVTVPDDFWYANIGKWSDDQKLCLRNFFLNVSDPDINLGSLKPIVMSWEAKYTLNRIANSDIYDFLMLSFIIQGIKASSNGIDVDGNPWIGLPGLVDTIQFSIQPSGAGLWDYEIVDYRFNMGEQVEWVDNKKVPKQNTVEKYNNYANKYLFSGSPFASDKIKECSFTFESNRKFILTYCKR